MKSFAANHFYREGGGNRKSWDEMNPARDTQVIDCLETSVAPGPELKWPKIGYHIFKSTFIGKPSNYMQSIDR